MKTTFQILTLGLALSITACQGDKGDLGPIGPQGVAGKDGAAGTAGTAGAAGVKGDQGAARVVYTAWKSFPTDKISRLTTGHQFSGANTTEAAFTKEAIDQGVILTYIKFNSLEFDANTQAYKLVETVNTNALHYFKIPGRTQNRVEDFGTANPFIPTNRRESFCAPVLTVSYRGASNILAPELQNLTDDQYRAFAKDLPLYRHMVIYGSTKGRLANIDLNDYAAVKAAFNIAD